MKTKKVFKIMGLVTYEVALEFDEETQDGEALAADAVTHQLGRSSLAVVQKGFEWTRVVGTRPLITSPREVITAEEIIAAARLVPERYLKRGKDGTKTG